MALVLAACSDCSRSPLEPVTASYAPTVDAGALDFSAPSCPSVVTDQSGNVTMMGTEPYWSAGSDESGAACEPYCGVFVPSPKINASVTFTCHIYPVCRASELSTRVYVTCQPYLVRC